MNVMRLDGNLIPQAPQSVNSVGGEGGSAATSVRSSNNARTTHACACGLREASNTSWHFYLTDCFAAKKGGTTVVVRKRIRHNYVDLPLLVSIEATRTTYRLEVVNTCLQLFINLRSHLKWYRHHWALAAGDLNAEHQFQTLRVRSCFSCFTLTNLKFQHHSFPRTNLLRAVVMYSALWSIRTSVCQDIILTSWTQIIYQSLST
jgi:hypothetical protein